MAARCVAEHHLTSPPTHPPPPHVSQIEWSLVESSRSHIREEVCSSLFHLLMKSRHNLPIMLTSYSPILTLSLLVILIIFKYPVISSPLYLSVTLLSLPVLFRFTHLRCSVLTIAPHEPICPQVQGGSQQRYLSSPPFSYLLPNLPLYSSSVY